MKGPERSQPSAENSNFWIYLESDKANGRTRRVGWTNARQWAESIVRNFLVDAGRLAYYTSRTSGNSKYYRG